MFDLTVAGLLSEVALRALEASLLGTPLLLAAVVADRLLRRRSAGVRHAIWLGAMVGQLSLLVAPGVTPEVRLDGWPGLLSDPVSVLASAGTSPVPAPSAARHRASGRMPPAPDAATGVFPNEVLAGKKPDQDVARGSGYGGVGLGAGPGILWGAGAAVALVPLVLGRLRRRSWRLGARPAPSSLRVGAVACALELGIRRVVRIRIGSASACPVTWGVLRPVVLLPASAAAWPDARLRSVLLHELAHVRRLDAVPRGLAEGLSVILWFHPLVWLVRRAVRDASEEACDDAVLHAGVVPSRYLMHLVAVARDSLGRAPAPTHPVFARGGRLERRAAAILDERTGPARPRLRADVLSAACAVLLALPIASLTGDSLESPPAGRGAAGPDAVGPEPGCRYEDGRHLDRLAHDGDRASWMVEWEGADCRVVVRTVGDVIFAPDLSGVEEITADAFLSIRVERATRSLRLLTRGGPDGSVRREWSVDGRARPFDDRAAAWLARFLRELDRHTAFAVDSRLPRLLATGGPTAVMAEAAQSRGGHAGGIYLRRLVESEDLSDEQVARVLEIARRVASVDAVMSDLLAAVRDRYDRSSPVIGPAYDRAVGTLQAEAALAGA